MVEAMPPSRDRVKRFTAAVRYTHWTVAILLLILIITAAFLYLPFLAALVGQRNLFKWVHIAAGLALPLPFVAAVCARSFRADAGRLNRFTPDDWRWLRRSHRATGTLRVGKFNAGQKLYAAVLAGALPVLFLTGLIMTFALFGDDQRTGATFVHDWFGFLVGVLVAGHIVKAWADPVAVAGMSTGFVPVDWAAVHHNAWVPDEVSSRASDIP